jgi:hypothetical protein
LLFNYVLLAGFTTGHPIMTPGGTGRIIQHLVSKEKPAFFKSKTGAKNVNWLYKMLIVFLKLQD